MNRIYRCRDWSGFSFQEHSFAHCQLPDYSTKTSCIWQFFLHHSTFTPAFKQPIYLSHNDPFIHVILKPYTSRVWSYKRGLLCLYFWHRPGCIACQDMVSWKIVERCRQDVNNIESGCNTVILVLWFASILTKQSQTKLVWNISTDTKF